MASRQQHELQDNNMNNNICMTAHQNPRPPGALELSPVKVKSSSTKQERDAHQTKRHSHSLRRKQKKSHLFTPKFRNSQSKAIEVITQWHTYVDKPSSGSNARLFFAIIVSTAAKQSL